MILSQLAEAHLEAVPAYSPEEAVAFCAANHVTAIVLDSEFVTENGWTVARSFRMVKPKLPIILLSINHGREVPPYVDAVAPTVELVLRKLKILLQQLPNEDSPGAARQS